MSNIIFGVKTRLLVAVVETTVNDMLDTGFHGQLKQSGAPIGLSLLAKGKTISIEEDIVGG